MAHNRSMEQIVNEQIHRWHLIRKGKEQKDTPPLPVICVSREAGTWGKYVAKYISQKLDLTLFDRTLLELIARNAKVGLDVVESLENKSRVALDEWLLYTISSRHIMPDQYLEQLMRVVGVIGQHGNAVILGRGAGFILPKEKRFHVRCVASMETRSRNWAEELGITTEEAVKCVMAADTKRKEFVLKNFNVDHRDPLNYDLVVNTDSIGLEDAAQLVIQAMNLSIHNAEQPCRKVASAI